MQFMVPTTWQHKEQHTSQDDDNSAGGDGGAGDGGPGDGGLGGDEGMGDGTG